MTSAVGSFFNSGSGSVHGSAVHGSGSSSGGSGFVSSDGVSFSNGSQRVCSGLSSGFGISGRIATSNGETEAGNEQEQVELFHVV